MRILPIILLSAGLAMTPGISYSLDTGEPVFRVAQNNGGKSLSQAIEQVRRQTGGQILSATTKVKGNREVHHVKVLTKDGKVRTVKVPGRRRGN